MKKRQLTALLLTAALLLPVSAAAEPGPHWSIPFVAQADWGAYLPMESRAQGDYTVEYRIEHDILQPDAPLTGGTFAEMVLRAIFPKELAAARGETLSQRAFTAAQSAGLLEGTHITLTQPVTRYDAAVLVLNALARYEIVPERPEQAQGRVGDFDEIPEAYRQAVAGVYALELASGKDSAGRYCGGDPLTLGEGCVLAGRMLARLEEKLDLLGAAYSLWQGDVLFTGLWADTLPLPLEQAVQSVPELALFEPDGAWQRLAWPGLEADVYLFANGARQLCRLTLTLPGVSTFHGISVGSTAEELAAAYQDYGWLGEEDGTWSFVPELYWGAPAPDLRFTVEDGVVTAIELAYCSPKNG